jgi:hypothetical protein
VSVEDDKRSGRPSTRKTTENVEKFWELIHEDHCWAVHELADTVGISYGVCQEILTENLNVCCIATKFIPQLLTDNQKQRRVNACFELREKVNEDPYFISRIIMGDESWIYDYDPETRRLRENMWRKDRNFGATTTGSFHAPAHTSLKKKNNRVCHQQQHGYCYSSSLLVGLSPLWFRFVSQIENETEGITFWDSVWHPKGIASSTRHY